MKSLVTLVVTAVIVLVWSASTHSQTHRTAVTTFQLGSQAIRIPAPEGFEEAASQFESIKELFSRTEVPENDVLAVHLTHAECERLRAGGKRAQLSFYTKVSVLKGAREQNFSAEAFAEVVAEFRKTSTQLLDVNGPTMKRVEKEINSGLTELDKLQTEIDFSQPINLGEFDTRPNVYSVMLVLAFTTKVGDRTRKVPLLTGLSYIRTGQRLIYVYTYRRYNSTSDVEVLRGFTRKWIGQILAANRR